MEGNRDLFGDATIERIESMFNKQAFGGLEIIKEEERNSLETRTVKRLSSVESKRVKGSIPDYHG